MYSACRHIKPNGLRCQSPAMRGNAFCYFHSKAHAVTRSSARDDLHIPLTEEPAAVQLAVSQIIHALLAKHIGAKEAGVALYGLQIASQSVKGVDIDPPDSVRSATNSREGEELAPPLCVDEEGDDDDSQDCSRCAHRRDCVDYTPTEDDRREDDKRDDEQREEARNEVDAGSVGVAENAAAVGAEREPLHSVPCSLVPSSPVPSFPAFT